MGDEAAGWVRVGPRLAQPRLVAAAAEYAEQNGARAVEAYAIDTDQRSLSSNELFVGSVRLFVRNGFVETSRPLGARVVLTRLAG